MSMDFLNKKTVARLEEAAAAQGVSPAELVQLIVEEYFAEIDELRRLIAEGDADIAAGRIHSEEAVRERLAKYAASKKKSSA